MRVDGVTAKGQVACFVVARETTGVGSQIVRREALLADDDADGSVRLALGRAVPPRSVWAAVDLASGSEALAAPAGYLA